MKKLRVCIVMTLFLVITGVLLTGCSFRYSIGKGSNFLSKEDAKEFNVDNPVLDPITSIVIYTGAANVELIESDHFAVVIDYLYWEEEPEYTLENGKFYFDDRKAFPESYSINFNLDNKIKIYLPASTQLTDLSIQNASGDVTLSGFIAENMQVTISYGDFELKNAASKVADITLSSGTSKISEFQAGKLNFTNSYGNAIFTKINTDEMKLPSEVSYDSFDINMSSGDVTINQLNVNSASIRDSYGNISLNKITAEDFRMDLSSGNLELKDGDLQHIDVSNSYGDVTLQLIGIESDYSMNLNTSYGDIKVGSNSYD